MLIPAQLIEKLLQETGKAVIIRKDDIRVMNAYINRGYLQLF